MKRPREALPIELARMGARAKALPKPGHAQPLLARQAPETHPFESVPELRLAIVGTILRTLEPVDTHAERMRLLAAVASLHHDADEASWFLKSSVSGDGERCARCGRAERLSKFRNG